MRIDPGGTIGIIGGGQLGRMLALAAARLGYKCHIFAPDGESCAAAVSAAFTRGDYADSDALALFANSVDVVTYEFENVPAASLEAIVAKLRPGVASLQIGQERAREKEYIESIGAKVGGWIRVDSEEDLASAERELGLPLVLKTRMLGYDGKGQAWARTSGSAAKAWEAIDRQPAIAEAGVDFDCEFSVVLARDAEGNIAVWDLPRNDHEAGVLRRSTVPAGPLVDRHCEESVEVATAIAESLGHVGVLTVEFFACRQGPLVNEIAPRVHNSGHWTIDGSATSQFEQHIRAICGLALGSTERRGATVVMENLLGDEVESWPRLVAEPGAQVHLYGKGEPRPGRKMGHVTRVTPWRA